jgi:hypothetical protein
LRHWCCLYLTVLALERAVDEQKRLLNQRQAVGFEDIRRYDDVGDAGLVLQAQEDSVGWAFSLPGALWAGIRAGLRRKPTGKSAGRPETHPTDASMEIVRDGGELGHLERREVAGFDRNHPVLALEHAVDQQKRLLDQRQAVGFEDIRRIFPPPSLSK